MPDKCERTNTCQSQIDSLVAKGFTILSRDEETVWMRGNSGATFGFHLCPSCEVSAAAKE